jgi:hypothetical protein
MAKKQSRRSVSLSKLTYERLKSFCEANGQSMSQFVETRIGDFLGRPSAPRAAAPAQPSAAPATPPKAAPSPAAPVKSTPPQVRSAPNPGARPAPAPSSKPADEPAARRAADRIFTF